MSAHNIAALIGEIAEPIVAVKGKDYMVLLAHAMNFQNIGDAIRTNPNNPHLAEMCELAHAHALSDLSRHVGFDIDNDVERKEFYRNLDAIRAAVNKK
jgi:hypothetical protein